MLKPTEPGKLGFSPDRLKRINDFMARYVDGGKIAGFVTLVARRGEIVYLDKYGFQDLASQTPIKLDTIFRIYSMTKPITSVAFMMLVESGRVRLSDPISKYIPEFKETRVYAQGGELVDPLREITVHDLLRHTAGLSYGGVIGPDHPVKAFYNQAGLFDPGIDLLEMVRRIAGLPLAFHPGTKWRYSVATDVVGHLIERITDQPLPDVLYEKILKPLGMVDTSFNVPAEKAPRLSTLYGVKGKEKLAVLDRSVAGNFSDVKLFLGGSGLVSTILDYYTFAQMVLNRGEFGGLRFLGTRTVEYMRANHLAPSLLPIVMEAPQPGFGFGLGFNVMLNPPLTGMMGSVGVHGWGGFANTHFWIDPQEQLIGIMMLQYIPSGTYPVTNDFRTAVYQALID